MDFFFYYIYIFQFFKFFFLITVKIFFRENSGLCMYIIVKFINNILINNILFKKIRIIENILFLCLNY